MMQGPSSLFLAENISVEIAGKKIVDDVSFTLRENERLMIIGPNGAGKTTLIRAVAGAVPHAGGVFIGGQNLLSMKRSEIARRLGVLTQQHEVASAYTVAEIVKLGRYAHTSGFLSRLTPDDEGKVERALAATGLLPMRNQSVLSLSGGELQRVFLAQLFAQEPQVLILDEPTNHLDLQYRIEIFDMLEDWAREPGHALIAVVHDLSLALRYGTAALLMAGGKTAVQGDVREVITREHLQEVYGSDIFGHMQKLLELWNQ